MPILDKYGKPYKSTTIPRKRMPYSPVNKSHRDYVADGLTPDKVAPIFRAADQGDVSKQAQLFEQLLEKDGHLLSEWPKRVNAIASQYLDWQLSPATDSQRDLDVVNFIERYVLDSPVWHKYKIGQQYAVGYGYSGLEPVWDMSANQAVIRDFLPVEPRLLSFSDPATGYLTDWPYLVTDEHPEGIEIHPRGLILHKTGGMFGHAARCGVFRTVVWMIVFKHFAIKDWWTFSELCGIPLRIGYYDSGSSEEDRATLERALANLGVDMYALISRGTKIEFEEAAAKVTGADLWKEQTDFCNNEISKALVGSSAFSEAGKSGSYALHTLETGVRADLTLADAQATAATDLEQWIAPLVEINFGRDTPVPRFEAVFKKQDDLETKSKWLEAVADRIGDRIPLAWYTEQYGIPELQAGDRTVAQVSSRMAAAKLMMAKSSRSPETVGQADIDRLAAESSSRVSLAGNEERILSVIRKSSSYEEVYKGLADLYSDLDMSDFQQVMGDALLAAQAAGIKKMQDIVEGKDGS